jgi:hypothetical protein
MILSGTAARLMVGLASKPMVQISHPDGGEDVHCAVPQIHPCQPDFADPPTTGVPDICTWSSLLF